MSINFDLALELLAESQESQVEYDLAHDLAIFVEEFGNLISQACEDLRSTHQDSRQSRKSPCGHNGEAHCATATAKQQ